MLHGRGLEECHGGEADALLGAPLKQVQDNWNDSRGGADEKQRRQKGDHAVLDRVDRYASKAISSGCFVLSN